ncbi:MAG TPA: DUF2332 family protein [Longimicrobiales bacterium]|nr:DUF2332 family protein [Longimicrobiales bacterium]
MGTLDGLLEDLAAQRDFVAERAPVYARILELLPDVLPWERLEEAWAGRSFGAWYERPLLILAGLRNDALAEGAAHPLWRAMGNDAGLHAVTRDALGAALSAERGLWHELRHRHLQTNETSRAVAWLWPAHLLANAVSGGSLEVFDIGASAGLNLVADALPGIWTGSDGTPLEIEPLPRVVKRRGYDLRPLDPDDEDAARWLRACVWPGQGERERRLERALAAWRTFEPRPELVTARAGDVPDLLPRGGGPMLAFQTVMRDYLPDTERERYEVGMARWLADCPPGRAMWVELEVTETAREGGPPAAITAHLRDATYALATCDPHPTVLAVDDAAVREFSHRLG